MHNIIAVIFDFDDTLAPDSTTGYLHSAGLLDTAHFWQHEVTELINKDWDPVPAYLHAMIEKSRAGTILPITRESLSAWGRKLPLHDGVMNLFPRLRECVRQAHPRVTVEFYLISSGIGDILRHTRIAHEFTDLWTSEFDYDALGQACFMKKVVSFTDKTRYLFHIQKGLIGPQSRGKPFDVNRKFTHEQTRIPMDQFIFVGDGMTDIPCFSLVNKEKGIAIGVYDQDQETKWGRAYKFVTDRRVNTLYTANYVEGSDLSNFLIMAVRNMAEQIAVQAGSYQA